MDGPLSGNGGLSQREGSGEKQPDEVFDRLHQGRLFIRSDPAPVETI